MMQPDFDPQIDMKSRPSVFVALTFFISLMTLELCAPRALAAKPPALAAESVLWTAKMSAAVVGSPALNFDGTVLYVGTANGRLNAVDFETGETNWSVRLPAAPTSSPTVNEDGLVYIGTANGSIYGISDLGDEGSIDFAKFIGAGKVASPAVDDDGNIYAGTTGNGLHALRPDSSKLWSTFFSNDVRSPMIAEDKIYVVAGGWVRGVNPENGAVESSFTPRAAIQGLPALGLEDTVYFGANDSRVYALNASGDTNDWRFNTGKNVASSPAVGADGSIYIGSDSARIFCLNSNGVLLWKVATAAPVRSALSIGVDGTIYAGCDDGRLYAVSAAGELLWTVKTKAPVRSAAVLDAFGVVYFASGRNVFAIQTEAAADDSDEAPWPMARKDRLHTARATECRPFLIREPLNADGTNQVTLNAGDPVSFSVVVRAGAPVTYQWRLNGVEIDPSENRTATNATFEIAGVSALDSGEYTVFAFNDCGEVESESFILDVLSGPVITMQPTNVFTLAGNTVTLRVGVVGTPPLAIQWKKDGVPIPNATNATFSITNAQPSDSSTNYSVMITNSIDPFMVVSDPVTVQVFPVTLTLSEHVLGAGHRHSLAVLSNKTLWAWGLDNFGQLGDNQTAGSVSNFLLRNVPALVLGTNAASSNMWASVSGGSRVYNPSTNQPGGFSLGIQTNGTLWAWGLNDHGQLGIASTASQKIPTRVGTDTNWVQVEAGATHSIGLKRDGSIWTWGGNEAGQLGIGSRNTNSTSPVRVGTDSAWVEVRAGGFFSLARRADGTIWAWGTNRFGELGIGINSGSSTNFLRRVPMMVGTNSDWASVSAGAFHALALKTNGTIWSWGRDNFGQLGVGGAVDGRDTHNENAPLQIGTSSNWTTIEAGSFHSFAIDASGGLFGWGANFYGQLGNGEIGSVNSTNDANRGTPVPVAVGMAWRSVDASDHSLGMTTDERIWAWGLNNFGQVGDGTGGDGTRNNDRSAPVPLSFNVATNNTATNVPMITVQPASQTALQSTTVVFNVVATSPVAVTYQWFFNSTAISSAANVTATNSTLQLGNVQAENVGDYFAVAINQFGRATSSIATLLVTNSSGQSVASNAPAFSLQPVDMLANEGATVTFTSMATGTPVIVYQWYFATNLLASQTNASLVLANVQGTNARFYYAVATNLFGAATSRLASLTITNTNGFVFPPSDSGTGSGTAISNSPPIITKQPVSQTTGTNVIVIFSVNAVGASPLSYSWRLNSNAVDVATNTSATNFNFGLTNTRPVGTYFYDVIVSNTIGSVTSAVATLVVTNGGIPTGPTNFPDFSKAASADVFLESIIAQPGGIWISARGASEDKKLVLEYKDLLTDPEWKTLGTNDAGKTLLVDPAPPRDRSRYYRVRVE
jgi:alpha-tubulin suppressor-like RCC1 family protein/outer membrane protein assembly factor BamB